MEVLHGDGSPRCILPRLPQIRVQHSQTGLETCGGGGAGMSCVKLSEGGSWTPSHHLAQERYGHTSWASPVGRWAPCCWGATVTPPRSCWRRSPETPSCTSTSNMAPGRSTLLEPGGGDGRGQGGSCHECGHGGGGGTVLCLNIRICFL